MKKVIKSAFTLLVFFFSFSLLSAPEVSNYPVYKKYVFYFSPPEGEVLQMYKAVSVYQTKDYLLFDVDQIKTDELKYMKGQECFFKRVVPLANLDRVREYSKVVFSLQEIERYNLAEPGEPILPLPAPLPYKRGPGQTPSIEEPGEPILPLPAPLPYKRGPGQTPSIEKSGEPIFPLPAPLPYKRGPGQTPSIEEPGEPIFPLPAPLPYYINPHTNEYIIVKKSQEEVISIKSIQGEWSDDIDSVVKEHFYHLKKTCGI